MAHIKRGEGDVTVRFPWIEGTGPDAKVPRGAASLAFGMNLWTERHGRPVKPMLRTFAQSFCRPISASGQATQRGQAWEWMEYVYPADGFAMRFHAAPSPHPDPQNPNITVYTSSFPNGGLSVRVVKFPHGCDDALQQIVNAARQSPDGPESSQSRFRRDPATMTESRSNGKAVFEYRLNARCNPQSGAACADDRGFERFMCADGRLYAFSASWTGNESSPPDLNRALSSFRLLSK